MSTYNLLTEPWIPLDDGQKVGLQEVLLQSHVIKHIQAETPATTAAILRLLMAIIRRIYPKPASRYAAWKAGQFDQSRIEKYFETWKNAFYLFDSQRPFLQNPNVPQRSTTVINKLVMHYASGTTVTLADHHLDGDLSIPYDEAARALVATMAFGLAGLSGVKGDSFTGSPWVYRMIFFAEGENLLQTILLNILPDDAYPRQQDAEDQKLDVPMWEQENPWLPRDLPYGACDYLTWPAREILLIPDLDKPGFVSSMIWVIGPFKKWVEGTRDPYMALQKRTSGDGTYHLRASYEYKLSVLCAGVLLEPDQRPFVLDVVDDFYQRGLLNPAHLKVHVVGVAGKQKRLDGQPDLFVDYQPDPEWQALQRQAVVLAGAGWDFARNRGWSHAINLASQGAEKVTKQARDKAKLYRDALDLDARYWGALNPYWGAWCSGAFSLEQFRDGVEEAAFVTATSLDSYPRGDEASLYLREDIKTKIDDLLEEDLADLLAGDEQDSDSNLTDDEQ